MASWFTEIVSAGKDIAVNTVSKAAMDIASLTNPSMARLANARLNRNGTRNTPTKVERANVNYASSISKNLLNDWRVRVSTSSAVQLYGTNTGVTAPLANTNGVVFPYTPQITVTHQANYSPQKFTHSNYAMFSYENSEVQAIQINADFTVQTQDEAKYLLACIYFFRAATKMYFGQSPNAGNPPPLVYLDGYGTHYFPHVPCLVTQFSHTMPSDVDYLETNVEFAQEALPAHKNSKGVAPIIFRNAPNRGLNEMGDMFKNPHQSTRVPTSSQLNIVLQPVYSKKVIGDNFNLHDFAQGKLVDKGGFI